MLELQFSLTPERPDQRRTPLHGAQAIASTGFEVVEVGGATVAEFVMLQITPVGCEFADHSVRPRRRAVLC